MASKKSSKKNTEKSSATGQSKTISENRRARHKFEILEQLECGMVLLGSEVKSLREGHVSLDEAYVRFQEGALWLIGADIAEYRQANIWNHAPRRPRKLLVHAKQLQKLSQRAFEKGMTLIPLRLYINSRGVIKLMIGVGRGKKLHDKRESLKKADVNRQIGREMRNRRK